MDVDIKAIQKIASDWRGLNFKQPKARKEVVLTPEQRVRRDKLEDAKNRITYGIEDDLL